MTTYSGCCLNPFATPPLTAPSVEALAGTLGPHPIARIGGSTARYFPAPDKVDLAPLRELVDIARKTGWRVFLDPDDLPPWVTGGVPVAVAAVNGSSCQVLAQWGVERRRWEGIYSLMKAARPDQDDVARGAIMTAIAGSEGLTSDPRNIAWHFVDEYRKEQKCSWAWDIPEAFGAQSHGGEHVWGAEGFEAQDALSAPRTALLSADTIPKADTKAVQYIAETLADEFGDDVDFIGIGINEPDVDLFNTLIRLDGVNGGPAGDTIKDRLIPERIAPWLLGLQGVRWGRDRLWPPRVLGANVAYSGTQPRFTRDLRFDVDGLSGHLYGDLSNFPADSYAHARSYAEQAKAHDDWWLCTEIDCERPAEWLRALMSMELDPAPLGVIWLDGNRFIEGFEHGGTARTEQGVEMRAALDGINVRRRAVRSA